MINYRSVFSEMPQPEMEAVLFSKIEESAFEKYGGTPDPLIIRRMEEEWAAMERSHVIPDVAALYELTVWLKKSGHPYWMRGLSGSSFILYLLGITTGDPLPPHRYCPKCKSVQWEPSYADGFDIPQDTACAVDDTPMRPDGHDIPWQTIWGFGDFQAAFDIDLPAFLYEPFRRALPSHRLQKLGADNFQTTPYDNKAKCIKLSNISLMFVLEPPKTERTFYEREYTASDLEYIMRHWKPLVQYSPEEDVGIPEPTCFADVAAISGLLHSAGTWDEVTWFMTQRMGYSPSDMIAFRDDVYRYLIGHGFLEKDAWKGMERVRKGLCLPVITEEMRLSRDKWVLRRCEQAEYLPPKAHVIEHIFFMLKSHDFSSGAPT